MPLQRVIVLKWFYNSLQGMGIGRPSQQQRVVLRRRNTFVGGKCALPSALLVYSYNHTKPKTAVFQTRSLHVKLYNTEQYKV